MIPLPNPVSIPPPHIRQNIAQSRGIRSRKPAGFAASTNTVGRGESREAPENLADPINRPPLTTLRLSNLSLYQNLGCGGFALSGTTGGVQVGNLDIFGLRAD